MSITTKHTNATIACSNTHSAVIMSDNTIRCWGKTSENQCDPLHRTFTNAIQVACGSYHSVALLSDGTVQYWGCAYPYNPLHRTFTDVIQVACGFNHSVALLSNGTVRCWGSNHTNQCDPVHIQITNVKTPCNNVVLW